MRTQQIKVKYLTPDKDVKLSLDEYEVINLLELLERSAEMAMGMLKDDKTQADQEFKATLEEDLVFYAKMFKKTQKAAALAGMGE